MITAHAVSNKFVSFEYADTQARTLQNMMHKQSFILL